MEKVTPTLDLRIYLYDPHQLVRRTGRGEDDPVLLPRLPPQGGTPGTVAPPLLDNQVLLAGQQFERVKRLKRHGFEAAVCDSPVEQGLLYCPNHVYFRNLKATIDDLMKEFEPEVYNVWINPRPGSYDPESRVQRTEAEARALDKTVRKLLRNKFWMEVDWDEEEKLGDAVVKLALSKRTLPRKPSRKR
jgi:hypothetical protein